MRICFNCGKEQPGESAFCCFCGTDLRAVGDQATAENDTLGVANETCIAKKSKTKKAVAAAIAVAVVIAVILGLIFGLPSSKGQLRRIGLDVISELKYLTENDEYAEFMDAIYGGIELSSIRDSVCTDDYDEPVAVYALEAPSFEEMMKLDEDFDETLWEDLPRKIQKDFESRYSSGNLHTMINTQSSVNATMFTSVYFANKEYKRLNIKKPKIYLYAFEEGTPVVVYFYPSGYASAYYLLADCDFEDVSETKEFFETYKYDVKKVYIAH